MLKVEEVSLPSEPERKLREWLNRSEFDTLVIVLEAQAKVAMGEFLNTTLNLDKYPLQENTCGAHMDKARHYRTCLEILKELRGRATFTSAHIT